MDNGYHATAERCFMIISTLVYLIKGNPASEVLLGLKQRGWDVGKYNGIGGKVEHGESSVDAAVREVKEEVGIDLLTDDDGYLDGFNYMGNLFFGYNDNLDNNIYVNVFRVTKWSGDPAETAEIRPRWFSVDDIPYHMMNDYDDRWMPYLIGNHPFDACFNFDDPEHAPKISISESVYRGSEPKRYKPTSN